MVPAGAVRGPSAPDDHSRLPPGRCRVAESSVDRIRGRHAGRGRGNRRRLRAGVLAHPEKAGRPARFPVGGAAVLPAISLPVLLPRLYGHAVAAARPVRAHAYAGAATRPCGSRGTAVPQRPPEPLGLGRLTASPFAVAAPPS